MFKRLICVSAIALIALSTVMAQATSFGLGHSSNFRVGPGKDSAGVQVYSFNYVYATVLFDAKGRIVDLEVDALEVSTPNYDGASMPHFTGWPNGVAYNVTDHETEKVSGTLAPTVDTATAEVGGWQSKRDRGDTYGMNEKNDWWKQMDTYEKNVFIGKTVDEVEAWFAKYTSDVNGRILNVEKPANDKDKAKLAPLSDADKKILVDARTGATMSINDAHGYVVKIIRDAWNKKKPIIK